MENLELRCQFSGVPFLVADIAPGATGSTPDIFQSLDGTAYFTANDGVHGGELWRSNATRLGTELVEDLRPGPNGSFGSNVIPATINSAVYNGRLYFAASDPIAGRELRSVGNDRLGIELVKDILPGSDMRFGPTSLTVAGGLLFFNADDGVHGRELWKSDGTADGTALVADLWTASTGISSPYPNELTSFQDSLYFAVNSLAESEDLWQSQGNAADTMLAVNGAQTLSMPVEVDEIASAGPWLYFSTESLARTDGTNAGTIELLPESACESEDLMAFGQNLVFTCEGRSELWLTDGSPGNTKAIFSDFGNEDHDEPKSLTVVNDLLYFTLEHDGNEFRIYRTDGTAVGTQLVSTFLNQPNNLTADPDLGTLYFAVDDGVRGSELWKIAGPTTTSTIVSDLRPGAVGSSPQKLHYADGRLYFSADDGVHGRELWALATSTPISGDLNFDGVVDRGDIAVLADNFGGTTLSGAAQGDFNGDFRIGLTDLLLLRRELTQPSAAASLVANSSVAANAATNRNDSLRPTASRARALSAARDRAIAETTSDESATITLSAGRQVTRDGSNGARRRIGR